MRHSCQVTDSTAIQGGSDARRPDAGRHDSRGAGTGAAFPSFARRIPATHFHQSLLSVVAWLPHQADARTGGNAIRWAHDACGNAGLGEVSFAKRGIWAILEHVDLSSAPRDAAYAAMCLLGRLVWELAEATVSHAHAVDDDLAR